MLRIRAYKHPCSQNDMIFLYDRMKKATLPLDKCVLSMVYDYGDI